MVGALQITGDDREEDRQQGSETADFSPQPEASQDVPAKPSKGGRKKQRLGSAPHAEAAKGKDQVKAAAVAAAEEQKTGGKGGRASRTAASASAKQGGLSKPADKSAPVRSKAKQQKPEVFTVDWIMDAKVCAPGRAAMLLIFVALP